MKGKANDSRNIGEWRKEDCQQRPHGKQAKCKACDKGFNMHKRYGWKGTKIMVREAQVSCMRGDDIVEFVHPRCLKNYNKLNKGAE
ncbi:MAG TPA: hypothetical protein ENH85_11135 [Candidatus Scalindua sp.]|nr:hypothetical protein [Candidatus Scalindua sp.]